MSINFVLAQMHHLRYIMPLIIEANRRGVHSVVRYCTAKKCFTQVTNHLGDLNRLASIYSFGVEKFDGNFSGLTFLMDGRSWPDGQLPPQTLKVLITVNLDFTRPCYDAYKEVDYVIFASKFVAEHYKKIHPKNLYLGCPKYDVKFDKEGIKKKYGIVKPKNALLIDPHPRSGGTLDVEKIADFLHKMDYNVIVKSRRKHVETRDVQGTKGFMGDMYFEDQFSWFPHATMELLSVCDIVINTDSATVKECVFAHAPLINFHIKTSPERYPNGKLFTYEYLFNSNFCDQLPTSVQFDAFKASVERLTTTNFDKDFEEARQKYFLETDGNASKKILDRLLK